MIKILFNDKVWREYFCKNYYVKIENPITAINCNTCKAGPFDKEKKLCKTCRDKIFNWEEKDA